MLLWLLLAFVAVRVVGVRYLGDPVRATVTAAAVVVAFGLGTLWPYGRSQSAPVVTAAPAAQPIPPPTNDHPTVPLSSAGTDVRSVCSSAVTGATDVAGHVDLAGVVRGVVAEPKALPMMLHRGDQIVFMGWATDVRGTALARAACLVIDGKVVRDALVRYRLPRPDIASAYKNDGLLDAGFQIVAPVASIPVGPHRISVAVVASNGSTGALSPAMSASVK